MDRAAVITHIITVTNGRTSRAVTSQDGFYLGAVNELAGGRYEALVPGEAHDEEPTFSSEEEACDYLASRRRVLAKVGG